MNCKFCYNEISSTDRFCSKCGANLQTMQRNTTPVTEDRIIIPQEKICKSCGNTIPQGVVVCPACKQWANVAPLRAKSVPTTNYISIAALICAFLSPILGLIFGCVGLSRSRDRLDTGRGLSISAIIVSIIMFFVNISILSSI